jgi:hypothetical protein
LLKLGSVNLKSLAEREKGNYRKLPVGKEPSSDLKLFVGNECSSGLKLPVTLDSAGLRKFPVGFASEPVRRSPIGNLPSSPRSGFALRPPLDMLPNSNGLPTSWGLLTARFLAGSCLDEIGASISLSRSGSFDSTARADGEALEEDVSVFVLFEAGEESLAA